MDAGWTAHRLASNREGTWGLFWKAADGTGDVERLVTREGVPFIVPYGWSLDGTKLVFHEQGSGTGVDIGVLSMEDDRAVQVLIQSEFSEAYPAISPDGRWMAYTADLSGRNEIYVERFPDLGGRLRVSTTGGFAPLWSPDGRQLFYRSINGRQVIAVPVATDPVFAAGTPEVLFEGSYFQVPGARSYDVAPDGERFVMVRMGSSATDTDAPAELILVQNWFDELRRLVPTN